MHHRPSAMLCASILLSFACLAADKPDPIPPVSNTAIEAHIRFLADDTLRGRDTGSEGHQIAANYVASQFRQLGLEPAGDGNTYFQAVPLREVRIDAASTSMTLTANGETTALVFGEDFVASGDPTVESVEVTAPVVFAGFGVSAPSMNHDDYAGLDVKGKIIVVFKGAPASFPSNERAHFSSSRSKAQEAIRRGAVGILQIRTNGDEKRVPWKRITMNLDRPSMRWLRADGAPADTFPELRVSATLSHEAAAKLFAGVGPIDEILDGTETGKYKPAPLPVEVAFRSKSSFRKNGSINVAGILRGSDPKLAPELVAYTAHLDHVGVGASVAGDAIYNGAYDNATGVAIMLEGARMLAAMKPRPKRSILFIAVTGEEKGMLGSDYFAQNPTVPISSIVADVNIDMPLFLFPVADIIAFGADHSSLDGPVRRIAKESGFAVSADPFPEEAIFIRSDQYSFVRRGVPSVFLVTGTMSLDGSAKGIQSTMEFFSKHYHQPSDQIDLGFDWDSVSRFTRANVQLGLQIANTPARPVWNKGDFFGELFGVSK